MNKHIVTGIAVAASLSVVALFFLYNVTDLSGGATSASGTDATATDADTEGLVIQDEVVGTGASVQSGNTIVVHYTGRLEDGTVFDSSVGKDPITVPIGQGYVIAGWDQGLLGMKEGGKRLLIIPPTLGYGPNAQGPIPANSTLIFEVELVKVLPAK
jgi:FKBP-type peptidyl-prolyl cis-trans isomerase